MPDLSQGARFVSIGVIVTGLHSLMQWGWCNGLGVSPWLGYLLALIVSFAVSFTLHRRVTFGSSVPIAKTLPAFAVLQAGQQILNYVIFLGFCWLLDGGRFGAYAHLVALGLACALVTIPAYVGASRIFYKR